MSENVVYFGINNKGLLTIHITNNHPDVTIGWHPSIDTLKRRLKEGGEILTAKQSEDIMNAVKQLVIETLAERKLKE